MILLDTCAVIWDVPDRQQLTDSTLHAIDQTDECHALITSDITIWEIAMLMQKERLKINTTASNFVPLYLKTRNIKDPADRIIAATSILQNAQFDGVSPQIRIGFRARW